MRCLHTCEDINIKTLNANFNSLRKIYEKKFAAARDRTWVPQTTAVVWRTEISCISTLTTAPSASLTPNRLIANFLSSKRRSPIYSAIICIESFLHAFRCLCITVNYFYSILGGKFKFVINSYF